VPGVDRPWYIGLILGTAGWFAGIFLLIFVFMLFKPDSGGGALGTALILLGAAWGLYMADREGVFVSQLALALSIAGQFALFYGVYSTFFKHGDTIVGMAMVGLVLQVALVALMPNDLHRTMSALFACIAWALLVRFGLWDDFSFNRIDRSQTPPTLMMMLAGWLIAWVPVGVTLYGAIFKGWLQRPVIVGLILGLSFATLVSYPLDAFRWFDGITRHSSLSVWPLLSAIASVIAIAAAFAIHSRGLMALCIVAAVLHVSHFYYQMDTSLLMKSIVMIGLGAAMLAGARRWK
jgi:hypothetical protein